MFDKLKSLIVIMGILFTQSSFLIAEEYEAISNECVARSTEQIKPIEFDKSAWERDHDLFIVHAIPKCGTHFIQKIVHLMTTKSLRLGPIFLDRLQECCRNNNILRSLTPYSKNKMDVLKKAHHKVIAMIRDPRDALISHLFYMRSFSRRTGDKTRRDFFTVGPDFDSLTIEQQITSLIVGNEHANSYIQYYKDRLGWALDKNSLTIKYEDLLGDEGGGEDSIQRKTIQSIATFININMSPDQLNYILDNMYIGGKTVEYEDKEFKRATHGNWRTFLTEEHKNLLKKRIGKDLIRLGYEKDLDW